MASQLPPPRPRGSTRTRLLAGTGLVVLLVGFAAIVFSDRGSDGARPEAVPIEASPGAQPPRQAPAEPRSVPVSVRGIGAYDPEGDRSENDSAASLATDGVPSTAWKSERYRRSFAKSGVGLVLDAGRPVRADRVVVVTETPGFTADVRVGSAPTGPFVSVSKQQSLKARTTFALKPRSGRYVMLWITSMPEGGSAAVNEITVSVAG